MRWTAGLVQTVSVVEGTQQMVSQSLCKIPMHSSFNYEHLADEIMLLISKTLSFIVIHVQNTLRIPKKFPCRKFTAGRGALIIEG